MLMRAVIADAAQSLPPRARTFLSQLVHGDVGPGKWWGATADLVRGRAGARSVVVVRDVSQVKRSAEVRDELERAFRDAGVTPCRLPDGNGPMARLAVEPADLYRVAKVLAARADARALSLRITRRFREVRTSAHRAPRAIGPKTLALSVGPRYVTPDGTRVHLAGVSDVLIEVWDRLKGGEERADGDSHGPGTRVPRLNSERIPYLIAEHWKVLSAGQTLDVPAFTLPNLTDFIEPIDAVYTWVDGDDPTWRSRKEAASGAAALEVHHTSHGESRFTSRDELRYSLRSLECFAPWIRHIYLVTDGQCPEWLNTDHPRISVVDHRDIFTDPSVLPVFNSHAIESQLHHIEGLSEHYLYLNDDVMFGRPVKPSTFFEGNGASRFFLSRATLDVAPASARDLPVLSAAKRNAGTLA